MKNRPEQRDRHLTKNEKSIFSRADHKKRILIVVCVAVLLIALVYIGSYLIWLVITHQLI